MYSNLHNDKSYITYVDQICVCPIRNLPQNSVDFPKQASNDEEFIQHNLYFWVKYESHRKTFMLYHNRV